MKRLALFVLAWTFLLPAAEAASFDCGKAKTKVEKLICEDAKLSKLDDDLSVAYAQSIRRSDVKQQTIDSQRQWLKNARDVCKNKECIKSAYETRIKELGFTSSFGITFSRPSSRNTSPKPASAKAAKPRVKKLDKQVTTSVVTAGHADDLIMDLGNGDAIRFAGSGDNFDCDDPAYADIKKRVTWNIEFADGGSKRMCAPEGSRSVEESGPPAPGAGGAPSPGDHGGVAIYNDLPADSAAKPVLHAIGVYEAKNKEIIVNVSDDARPLVLSLSAYDATHWKIRPDAGVTIQRIILSGYHTQKVTGMATDVPVETYTYDPSPCGQCTVGTTIPKVDCANCSPRYFYSYRAPAIQLKDIAGLAVTSFQGRYEGSEFTIARRVKEQ